MYAHLAESHSNYPIDIIVREYKSINYTPNPTHLHTEQHYEHLRRIRNDGMLGLKRIVTNDIDTKSLTTTTTTPSTESTSFQPVVLNSLLGMKGTTATVSSISTLAAAAGTAPTPLDEPLVNIDDGNRMVVEEDPLSLENEGATVGGGDVAAAAANDGGGGRQVDGDAGNLNFEPIAVPNVR